MAMSKPADADLRMVLVGKTGVGKSATANTILGDEIFESRPSAGSVTVDSTMKIVEKRFKHKVIIVDTPGLFDTGKTEEDIQKQLSKVVYITSPGPHVFLIVVQLGRFTKEEVDTIKELEKIFGKDMYEFAIVLFTRADSLPKGETLEKFLLQATPELIQLLKDCQHRYVGFDNTAKRKSREKMTKELFEVISKMTNGSTQCYTAELYRKAEEDLKKKEAELQEKLSREKQENEEKLIKLGEERAKKEISKQKKKALEQQMKDLAEENEKLAAKIENPRDTLREEAVNGGFWDSMAATAGAVVKWFTG